MEEESRTPIEANFSDGEDEGIIGVKVLAFDMVLGQDTNVVLTTEVSFGKDVESGRKTIGNYLILDEIGDGSFSTVKRLKNKTDPTDLCCLKIYNKVFLESQRKIDFETGEWTNLLGRIERELNIWVHLNHPNVAKLFEIYEEPGQQYIYLRMQLGDLGQVSEFDTTERTVRLNEKMVERYKVVKNINTREGVVKDVFRQMIQGLAYMHEKGYAHRDVKLENLVVNNNLLALWVDFNSSKAFVAGTRFTEYEGTLHYAAPECIFGLDEGYDPQAADLWSLGVCLYSLHFQALPYDLPPDDNEYCYEMDLNVKIRDTPVDYSVGFLPEDLREVLQGLLCKEVGKRWTINHLLQSKYLAI